MVYFPQMHQIEIWDSYLFKSSPKITWQDLWGWYNPPESGGQGSSYAPEAYTPFMESVVVLTLEEAHLIVNV